MENIALLALYGAAVTVLTEFAKWLVRKTNNVEMTKVAVFIIVLALSAGAAAIKAFAPDEILAQFAAVFAAATTIYATVYKYVVKPVIDALADTEALDDDQEGYE